jgi:hypothetical protein
VTICLDDLTIEMQACNMTEEQLQKKIMEKAQRLASENVMCHSCAVLAAVEVCLEIQVISEIKKNVIKMHVNRLLTVAFRAKPRADHHHSYREMGRFN